MLSVEMVAVKVGGAALAVGSSSSMVVLVAKLSILGEVHVIIKLEIFRVTYTTNRKHHIYY